MVKDLFKLGVGLAVASVGFGKLIVSIGKSAGWFK